MNKKTKSSTVGSIVKVLSLALLVLLTRAAYGQDILQDTVTWRSTKAVRQTDKSDAVYNCSFISYGKSAFDWVQNNGAKVYHFTTTSADGEWPDLKRDGQVDFTLQKGASTGHATISKAADKITIHLNLLAGDNSRIDYIFSHLVVQFNPITEMKRIRFLFILMILLQLLSEEVAGQVTGSGSSVGLNTSWTYSWNSGSIVMGPYWTSVKGTINSTWLIGTTYYANVTWTTTGAGNISFYESDGLDGRLNVTVSTCSGITAPTGTGASRCGTGSVTLTSSSPSGSNGIKWYPSSSSTSYLSTGTSYSPSISSTTTYYIAQYNTTNGCESSRVSVTGTVDNTGSLSPVSPVSYDTYSGTITLTGNTPTILRWEKNINSGGWTTISNTTTTNSYSVSQVTAQSTTLLRAVLNNNCGNPSYSSQTTVTVFPSPKLQVNGAAAIANKTYYNTYGNGITLSVPVTYYSYQWYYNGSAISAGSGGTAATYTPVQPGSYYLTAVALSGWASSTSVTITVAMPNVTGDSINSVSQTLFYKSGVTSATSPYSLQPSELVQKINYSDGLGRSVQTIAIGQSIAAGQASGDLVLPAVQGHNGLTDSTFLPYATTEAQGIFRHNAVRGSTSPTSYSTSEQYLFYQQAASTKLAADANPYARSVFRNTPDARVVEQGLPGAAWQPGTNHTQLNSLSLSTSTSSPVLQWKADGTTSGYYADNTVWGITITDENAHLVKSYKNKTGQTVMKQVQSGASTWLTTYYIYDDFGQLTYQISPRAMEVLGGGTSLNANSTSVKELIYQYKYDSVGHLIEKKVPGSPVQWIVYDKLGRVVLLQDGNQRSLGVWAFIKYDYKNRPVYTGLYTSSSSRTTLQKQYYYLDYTSQPWFETRAANATYLGYSNTVFPTSSLQVLSASYFDSYDFDYNGSADYSYDNTQISGLPTKASTSTRGLPTGSKKLILGSSNYLVRCVFYDTLDRPIQMLSNNHLTLTVSDKTSSLYFANNLSSNPQKIKTVHTGGTTVTVVQRYTYDNAWRPTGIYHTINSNAEQQVAAYQYNALGQVVKKQLHNTSGSNFMQNVDMRYNIRGWLTSINNAKLTSDGITNDDTNDYFGLELLYNSADASGLSNTVSYNGNVSAMKWKNAGVATGTADQRSYLYSYDHSDRLTAATFQANSGSSWNKEANTLNESMTYDANGNISTLARNQNSRGLSGTTITSSATAIDNLTYTYHSQNPNRVLKVDDASGSALGFTDGASVTNEYKYDTLGNMTVDKNKGISAVTYNALGKPDQVTFTNGNTIVYTYDAGGSKLKTVTTIGGTATTADYVNGFIYNNTALSFFASPEGRVVKNGSNYEYQYAIADHLGNTRVLFTSATPTPLAKTATFEGDGGDNSSEFTSVNGSNIVSFTAANHTSGGIKVIRMNQAYPAGPSKGLKVYAGDKVDMEVYAYYETASGYGSSNNTVAAMVTAIAGAFGGVSGGGGESGSIFSGVNAALSGFGLGSNPGDTRPSAFLNYILFDQSYKVVDMGWTVVPSSANYAKQQMTIPQVTVKEAGYIFVYLSYEDQSNNYVYFDDFKVTLTPTGILQSNEYLPYGLQTAGSWTRENTTSNNFLANSGTELNATSQVYDLDFRNYDPALGRMNQVDPLADKYGSLSPYNFSFNNPVSFSDPSGLEPPGGSIAYGTYRPGPEWPAGDQARNVCAGGSGGGGPIRGDGHGNYFYDNDGNGFQSADEVAVSWYQTYQYYSGSITSVFLGKNYVNDKDGNPVQGSEHYYFEVGYGPPQTQNRGSLTDLLLAGVGAAGLVTERQSAVIAESRAGISSGRFVLKTPVIGPPIYGARSFSKSAAVKVKLTAKGVGGLLTLWSIYNTEKQFELDGDEARRTYNHMNNGVGVVFPVAGIPMAAGDYLGQKYSNEIVRDVSEPGGFLFEGTKAVIEFFGLPTGPK